MSQKLVFLIYVNMLGFLSGGDINAPISPHDLCPCSTTQLRLPIKVFWESVS